MARARSRSSARTTICSSGRPDNPAGATPARSLRTNFSRSPMRAKKTCPSPSRGSSTPSSRLRVPAAVRMPAPLAANVLGEIFNIGGTEEVSMLELAKLVVKTLGPKSRIGLIPYDKAYAPGFDDMRRRKPLVEKLERFVKFKPQTPLREIIRLTAE